jgi:hypothetical protein
LPLNYDQPPPALSSLSQGEILWKVVEHRDTCPLIVTEEHSVQQFEHQLMIVVTQDCDLLWDWEARQKRPFDPLAPILIPHVFLCDVWEASQLRAGPPQIGNDIWRRIKANQDKRYHCLPSASFREAPLTLPELYIDFKKTLGLPTANLYAGLTSLQIARLALLPPVHLHDFIHRFYTFQSRVAVPE